MSRATAAGSQATYATARGARLVLLQELHNGAYFCQHQHCDEFDRAEPIPGPSTARLGALAKKHGVVIVGSLFERRAAGIYHWTPTIRDFGDRTQELTWQLAGDLLPRLHPEAGLAGADDARHVNTRDPRRPVNAPG